MPIGPTQLSGHLDDLFFAYEEICQDNDRELFSQNIVDFISSGEAADLNIFYNEIFSAKAGREVQNAYRRFLALGKNCPDDTAGRARFSSSQSSIRIDPASIYYPEAQELSSLTIVTTPDERLIFVDQNTFNGQDILPSSIHIPVQTGAGDEGFMAGFGNAIRAAGMLHPFRDVVTFRNTTLVRNGASIEIFVKERDGRFAKFGEVNPVTAIVKEDIYLSSWGSAYNNFLNVVEHTIPLLEIWERQLASSPPTPERLNALLASAGERDKEMTAEARLIANIAASIEKLLEMFRYLKLYDLGRHDLTEHPLFGTAANKVVNANVQKIANALSVPAELMKIRFVRFTDEADVKDLVDIVRGSRGSLANLFDFDNIQRTYIIPPDIAMWMTFDVPKSSPPMGLRSYSAMTRFLMAVLGEVAKQIDSKKLALDKDTLLSVSWNNEERTLTVTDTSSDHDLFGAFYDEIDSDGVPKMSDARRKLERIVRNAPGVTAHFSDERSVSISLPAAEAVSRPGITASAMQEATARDIRKRFEFMMPSEWVAASASERLRAVMAVAVFASHLHVPVTSINAIVLQGALQFARFGIMMPPLMMK